MRQVQARLVILSVAAAATLGAVHWVDGLDTRLREQRARELSRRLAVAELGLEAEARRWADRVEAAARVAPTPVAEELARELGDGPVTVRLADARAVADAPWARAVLDGRPAYRLVPSPAGPRVEAAVPACGPRACPEAVTAARRLSEADLQRLGELVGGRIAVRPARLPDGPEPERVRYLVRAGLEQAEPDSRELAVRELPAPDGGSCLLAVSAGDQPFVRWTSLAMACLAVLSCWLAAAGVLTLARPLPLPEPRLEPPSPAPPSNPLTSAATHLNHHLNNAFAVVIGNLEVLRDDAADPERQTLLDDVVGHAWHASGILRRFQRACLREPLARAAAVDLQDAAREAVTRVGSVLRDRRLVLRNLAGATVTGLPGDLVELLTALLENAVEATDSGDRIACEAERRGEHVVLTVSDNGRGMTEAVRRQAAQFFYTTRGPQAVGLGLTAVDGIVTRHGGRWWLDSSPGAGCVVTVILPAGPR